MSVEAIIMCVITGAISLMYGVLLRRFNTAQNKSEDRYKERLEHEMKQINYYDSVGNLTIKTATKLKEKGDINGDIDAELMECKKNKKEYCENISKMHA